MNPQIKWVSYALWLLLQVAMPLGAEEQDTLADSLMSISLTDGTQLEGIITQETETHILVETLAGLEVKVPRTSIVAIKKRRASAFSRPDPNYTRLMFAPTGRPLRRGNRYFFDYYVFFPGLAYGFSDRLGVAAGLSVVPGLGLSEQVLSLAPKVGLYDSGDVALSAGVLYMRIEDDAGGMAFVVGTKGSPDKSFTCGIGLGYIAEEGEDVDFAEHPVLLLGGNIRLSESLALVSENWLITGEDLGLDQQPLGLALRFFGPRIAVDAGVIIIGEVLKEGFPIPWLSFVYNFGD
ncbi:MAG: hypothetical protein F4Z85_21725 [Gemmatimonadetes bacterium]|nr:hypothetical protein [Gemmatimonadota bacterium]MYB68363.1 hypothetical protein [Gemmatimonadota bacterium]